MTFLLNILMLIAGCVLVLVAIANLVQQSDKPKELCGTVYYTSLKQGVWPDEAHPVTTNQASLSATATTDTLSSSSGSAITSSTLASPTPSFPNDSHPAGAWNADSDEKKARKIAGSYMDALSVKHTYVDGCMFALEGEHPDNVLVYIVRNGKVEFVAEPSHPADLNRIRQTWHQLK